MSKADRGPSVLEYCYAYFGIVYYEQGVLASFRIAQGLQTTTQLGESDPLNSLVQVGILIVLGVILALRWSQSMATIRQMMPYVFIIGVCLMSVFWSDRLNPAYRRAISLATCVFFGMYLYQSFGTERLLRMVGRTALCLGLLSIFLFVTVPFIGRETAKTYESAMRGAFPQKNSMGECMLLGVSCFAYSIVRDQKLRFSNVVPILILISCVALGQSASALAISMLVILVSSFMYFRSSPRIRLAEFLFIAWIGLVGLVLAILSPDVLFEFAGRDASLTGRLPLWDAAMGLIADRPLLGYGYGGFWDENSVAVQSLWRQIEWQAPNAHNGYLEVLIQIGAVGLVAYAWLWFRVISNAVRANRGTDLPVSRWVILFMVINVCVNFDEAPLPFPNEFTMMMVVALLTVSVWARADLHRRALLRWQPRMPILQRQGVQRIPRL